MIALIRSFIVALALLPALHAQAQYFGQNKPRYSRFDFRVRESDHFTFYSYLNDREIVRGLAGWAEQWYRLHQGVLRDSFVTRNPVIFYEHHADFRQTTAIFGSIGQGTGGVTEGFKNRVVLPLMLTRKATHHVIGHELVHAFQYRMLAGGDSTGIENMGNMPLWLIEGLAEYLSIGRTDPQTALWMRDAYLRDRIPRLKDLYDQQEYFPYRWGQAFWSFLTGTYGDDVIRPFFLASAKVGVEEACPQVLGMSFDSLSGIWVRGMKNHYARVLPDRSDNAVGKPVATDRNAGEVNVSPVLSPDGRYLIFVSEKDIFGMDMYLAEARTGKILRKIATESRDEHVEDFSTIESSATWSPKGDRFAFVATSRGRNVLIVKDAPRGRTLDRIAIPGVEAINYPAWSPDGDRIAFSGMVGGETDIWVYDLKRGRASRVTDGPSSDIMPAWSPDGQEIVFSSDSLDAGRGSFPSLWGFNIAVVEPATGQRSDFGFFPGADNLNPQFDSAGHILFLSDRDGFRDIYRYDRDRERLTRLTRLATGVTGITPYSPAISVSPRRDRLLYTHFQDGKYRILMADLSDLAEEPVGPEGVEPLAAVLPVAGREVKDLVNNQMRGAAVSEIPIPELKDQPLKPKFRLDYLGGGGGIGIGTGTNTFGTGTALVGGVDMLFSDILSRHILYATLMMNGELTDIGGQVQYLNQDRPVGWGARLLHIPLRSGGMYYAGLDTVLVNDQLVLADHFVTQIYRVFHTQGGLFAQYPISRHHRAELNGNVIHRGFRLDQYDDYYSGGFYLGQERSRLPAPEGFWYYSTGAALVGDRADWGMTAPLKGYRYRLALDQYLGRFDFRELTVDLRRYFWLRPISMAGRVWHIGRYGPDADNIQPMYIGDPTLVRGYTGRTFDRLPDWGLSINQLIGSSMVAANLEVRLPFTGPKRLALIDSRFLFTDLNLFLDGGMAYFDVDAFTDPENDLSRSKPVFSAGVSLRVNLFNALVLEPYYAWPLQRDTRGVFGLNFIPGF